MHIEMRRIFSMICAVAVCVACALAKDNTKDFAQATFPDQTCDLGFIKEEKGLVKCEFEVVNTGTSPLIIIDVKTSCGCTHPDYPKRPINPGKKAKIKVTYNPAGTSGGFRKSITVKTNGKEKRTTLYIEGSVIPKK